MDGFKSEKVRHRQTPETHCSADELTERLSFRKGTLNVFLRRDAEPDIQVLRYRPLARNSWIVTHLIVWDIFSRRECLNVC